MVDFQSRDTRRGLSDDEDEDEEEEEDEAVDDTPETADEPRDDERRAAEADVATGEDEGDDQPPEDGEHGHDDSHSHDSRSHGHDSHGHDIEVGQLGVAVVTVTSSRTRETDSSGDAIASYVEEADHEVVTRDVVADDLDGIQRAVLALTGRDDVDVVVTTGGTGVTPDDVTVEAIEPLFDKELPGFGELFRILSYEEVGTRALGTRSTAGISEGVPVFCLPGSEDAVRLGMEELVVEEVTHLVGLATRE